MVCGAPSAQWCGGCGNVSYCGVKHQRQHWSEHKSQCGTVKTCQSPELGKYLVAARDLSPGDLILEEDVSVLGPASEEEEEEVCVSCYYPSHGHTCHNCHAPLCGPSCQSDPSSPHSQECTTLASFNTRNVNITPFITALRFILLSKTDPKRFGFPDNNIRADLVYNIILGIKSVEIYQQIKSRGRNSRISSL